MNGATDGGHAKAIVPGTLLGRHGIRQLAGRDPFLGDRYAVVFGTTNRVYDINVASGEPGAATLRDYAAIVEATAALRHPCLFPYFACGEDDGVAWLRSEHTDGAPDWVTRSVAPVPSEKPGGETGEASEAVCFPTLQSLLEATGGRLAAKDRNLVIGDLAEALAFLHAHESFAGEIAAGTVFLDRTFRHSSLIARLRFYAFPEAAAAEAPARNLRQFGELIQMLLAASDASRSGKLDKALAGIARGLIEGGSTANGVDLYEAVCNALEDGGETRSDRLPKRQPRRNAEAETPPPTQPDSNAAVSRHRSSHRRHKKRRFHAFNSSSSTGQIVAMVLRIGLMFAGIVGVGVSVFLGMKYLEDQERAQLRITSAERYSAITIIEDKSAEIALQGFPERVDDYSREQLQTAADLGEPVAAARLALLTLLEDTRDPATRARADLLLQPRLDALERLAKTDPVAAYWLGYVRMVGLGGAPDAPRAVASLERAIAQGHADAGVLLGDWHAAHGPEDDPEGDRRALNCWRTAFGNPAKWTTTQFDAIDRIIRFVRARRGFKSDDAALARLLQSAAAAGHAEAVLLVSELYEQGLLVEKNDSTALSWLRRLGSNDAVDPALRAEVQRRMADMFAAGRGTPASASAARIWYERAAKLGNVKAMLSLAALCDSGVGAEGGRRTPDEARYWRDKAAATKPPSPPAPVARFTREMLPPAAAAPADKDAR